MFNVRDQEKMKKRIETAVTEVHIVWLKVRHCTRHSLFSCKSDLGDYGNNY